MLGGLAETPLAAPAQGRGRRRLANIVMGINVQVCWEKFANYWDVEMRLVPMEGDRLHLSADEAVKLCDENTIAVVPVLGSTFDGSYEPVQEICAALDDLQERTGLDVPVHVDGASGAFVAPFVDLDLEDFRLPRVASINASGHKYGLVYPGVGWVVWRMRTRSPTTSSSGSTTSATTCRRSRSTSPPGRAGHRPVLQLSDWASRARRVQAYAREVARACPSESPSWGRSSS